MYRSRGEHTVHQTRNRACAPPALRFWCAMTWPYYSTTDQIVGSCTVGGQAMVLWRNTVVLVEYKYRGELAAKQAGRTGSIFMMHSIRQPSRRDSALMCLHA
jgi:hypothetical protein